MKHATDCEEIILESLATSTSQRIIAIVGYLRSPTESLGPQSLTVLPPREAFGGARFGSRLALAELR